MNVSFFSYSNKAHKLIGLYGGAGSLKYFILSYKRNLKPFQNRPLNHPVIILIDNDDGAKDIFKVIKGNFNVSISLTSGELFYHLTDNLYLIKTPEQGNDSKSCIEDLFDPSVLKTKLGGLRFNSKKVHQATGEYGKSMFAEKVIRPNAGSISFSKFAQLLERIVLVVDHYKSNKQ